MMLDPIPLSRRMTDLIKATEDDLSQGIAPLSEQFLVDNDVSLDEAYSLSDNIRSALVAYRRVPANTVIMALTEEEFNR